MGFELRANYLWDGHAARAGQGLTVAVEGERIARVTAEPAPDRGESSRVLDFGEATILPGLIDMHTHLGINHDTGDIHRQMAASPVRHILAGAVSLWDDLGAGVTTAKLNGDRDGYDLQMRDAIRDEAAEGPRLFVSGRGLKSSRCTGGVVATCIADDAEGVARGVRENLAAGVDWIKLFASGSLFGPRQEVLRPCYGGPQLAAATTLAHAAGKPISVHCFGGEAADACLAAGVDVLDHGWLLTEAQLESLARRGIWLCATVGVLLHAEGLLARLPEGPDRDAGHRRVEEVREVMGLALRGGVPLLVGTDARHGGLGEELELLQELGGQPAALLRAATADAATVLGQAGEIGRLTPGARADLLVVAGDATRELGRLGQVLMVVKNGKIIRHAGEQPAYRTN